MKTLFTLIIVLFCYQINAQTAGEFCENFGVNGISQIDSSGDAGAFFLTETSNDKIIALGIEDGKLMMAQLNQDGTTDNTFGNGGISILDEDLGNEQPIGIGVQSDGKIIVAAISYGSFSDYGALLLVRFNFNGVLDTSFGNDGILLEHVIDDSTSPSDMAILDDDKIILTGWSGGYSFVARYHSHGQIDTSFGNNGVTSFEDLTSQSLSILPDNKILVGGYIYDDEEPGTQFAFRKFNSNGSIDNSFGAGGLKATNCFDIQQELMSDFKVASDQTIYASGILINEEEESVGIGVVKFLENGNIDSSFGTNGVKEHFGEQVSVSYKLCIQNDDKPVIIFTTLDEYSDPQDLNLMRLNIDGSIDSNFGNDGFFSTLELNTNHFGYDGIVSENGKILVAGASISGNNNLPSVFGIESGVTSNTYTYGGNKTLKTWPNPTTNTFKVQIPMDFGQTLNKQLINSSGQEVSFYIENIDHGIFVVDISKLPRGIYFFRISNENGQLISERIIKH